MKSTFTKSLPALLGILLMGMGFSGCITDCYNCTAPPPPCTWGPAGVPGPAFFGLDWAGDQPDYVWTNNAAIPSLFYYGDYYNSYTGTYNLYYEGAFRNGCCFTEYFWDVNFDVWVNAGTNGGCGFAGADGLPSYLMLVMGIDGPGELRTNKQASPNAAWEELSRTEDEIVLQHQDGDINVRATFKKLKESKRASLEDKGIKVAQTK